MRVLRIHSPSDSSQLPRRGATHVTAHLPTVHVVRFPNGSSRLIRIPTANPWVLRRPWLTAEDVD